MKIRRSKGNTNIKKSLPKNIILIPKKLFEIKGDEIEGTVVLLEDDDFRYRIDVCRGCHGGSECCILLTKDIKQDDESIGLISIENGVEGCPYKAGSTNWKHCKSEVKIIE